MKADASLSPLGAHGVVTPTVEEEEESEESEEDRNDPCRLPTELAREAFAEYQETPSSRRQAIGSLRRSIQSLQDPADKLKDLSDLNLIRFIRNRKYDLAKALQSTIDTKRFYTLHGPALAGTDGRLYDLVHNYLGIRVSFDVDARGGKAVLLMQPGKVLPLLTSEFLRQHPHFVLRLKCWVFDKLSRHPVVQVRGLICLFSFNRMSLWECISFGSLTTHEVRMNMYQHLSCLGVRLKGLYIFEAPFILKSIFAVVRLFLDKKLRQRFHVCGNTYTQVLPKVLGVEGHRRLPTSYEGEADESDPALQDAWMLEQLQLRQVWDP